MNYAEEYANMLRQERIEQENETVITYTTIDRHVKKDEKRYHLREKQHNLYIEMGIRCPACNAGSIPETQEEHDKRIQNEKLRE